MIQMFWHPDIPDFQILSKPYINGNIDAYVSISLNWPSWLVLCSGARWNQWIPADQRWFNWTSFVKQSKELVIKIYFIKVSEEDQRRRSQRQMDASSHTAMRIPLSRLKLVCLIADVHLGSVSVVHLSRVTEEHTSGIHSEYSSHLTNAFSF